MSFKVGDRVKTTSGIGKIIADPESDMPGVEYDKNIHGHACRGKGKQGYCFWVHKSYITLLKGHPIREKPVKYIVIFDENDVDPHKKFFTLKELKIWIKEAKEDEGIDFDSIEVYPTGKRLEVKAETKISLK